MLLALGVLLPAPAQAITVSGRVTEPDTLPVAGVTITIEQVGGELPLFTTHTGIDGSWSLTDPLLTGNVRITPTSSSFSFSPASRDAFTFDNLSDQNFTATATVPRPDITVITGFGKELLSGGELGFPGLALGATREIDLILRNDGTFRLDHISVSITGGPPGEFTLDSVPPTRLEPGAFAIFGVRMTPVTAGLRSATLVIRSDDPNEDPFLVGLQGTAVSIDVTNTADSGPGSLRQAILNCAITENFDTVRFDPSLSGATITLSNEIPVTALGTVTVDATTLPGGLTIRPGGASRIFKSGPSTLSLMGLTLTGGQGLSTNADGAGGAVLSEGTLLAFGCTFSNNVSPFKGGALACIGRLSALTVSNCTFLCNTGGLGGAIGCDGGAVIIRSTFACNNANHGGALSLPPNAAVVRSTLTGNSAGGGGAIQFVTGLFLAHCTIVGNRANAGGGLFSPTLGRVDCLFSIVTGNVPNDLGTSPAFFFSTKSLLQGEPLLAPLDDYGGPTKTMALLPGSPAREAATDSPSTGDQRGFEIVGTPDIGAYEAGTDSNFNAFISEHLPAGATAAEHAPAFDFDGDGADNVSEWLALTDPADPASTLRILRIVPVPPTGVEVTFVSSVGRLYQVSTSVNLSDWVVLSEAIQGTGRELTVPVVLGPGSPHQFLRLLASP